MRTPGALAAQDSRGRERGEEEGLGEVRGERERVLVLRIWKKKKKIERR